MVTDKILYINELHTAIDQVVRLRGWLYNKRSSKKVIFLLVRDGTGIVQAVLFKPDVGDELFELADGLTQESALTVTGKVRKDERAPGGYELQATALTVIQAARDYPITPKEHGIGFLMDHRHLWLRSRQQHAVLRLRSAVEKACRDFYDERGFTLIDSPILTPSACEGTTTLFSTDYFGQAAYLTQSGQLYLEAAAMAFGKVYCFGPTFRAEKSKTRRHLIEFWMIEPEVAFAELDDIMNLAEEFVEYLVGRALETNGEDLEVIERDTAPLEKVVRPFPRISYDEAVAIVEKAHDAETDPERRNDLKMASGDDFGAAHETVLADSFDRPVLIHRFPAAVKAFYMKADPDDPRLVLGADMLAPEGYGEIVGGGQREDDLEKLLARVKQSGLDLTDFEWYLDLRRFGSVPHSGFGMGLERFLSWLCKLPHLRSTIPFPRLLDRLRP